MPSNVYTANAFLNNTAPSIPQRHHYNGSAKETQVPECFDSRFPVSESIAFSEFCHAVVVRYVLEFEEGFFTKAILPCHNKPVV